MKSFTTQTILATLAFSVHGLSVQRGIMAAIEPKDVAFKGDTCEGFNEKTGKAFPHCARGLVCVDKGMVTIPGEAKHCIMDRPMPTLYASEGESCGGHNEVTGGSFNKCAEGLVCKSTNGIGIPGMGNVCVREQKLAQVNETCEGFD
jgi:hypothetical protein